MITALDHVIHFVRDLDAGVAAYRHAGFAVEPGGVHRGGVTCNALVRFDGAYIEVQAAVDLDRFATVPNPMARFVHSWLTRGVGVGGWLGFAVRTDDLVADKARLVAAGLDALPLASERTAADGRQLCWNLLLPSAVPWRTPWPVLIQACSEAAAQVVDGPGGAHPNGARRLALVRIAAFEVDKVRATYERIGLGIGAGVEVVPIVPGRDEGIDEVWIALDAAAPAPSSTTSILGATMRAVRAAPTPPKPSTRWPGLQR